jgi:succinate dehydrogenase / fumarate reductase flavoprotein subunit
MIYTYDVVIVGGGIAGLITALKSSEKCRVAVISKVHVTRSHSVAAQGGIAASLGNEEEDRWDWHMFDTVKGGDYLTDQNAAKILAIEAAGCVSMLEHMGVPFSRNLKGKIQQRRFGGHTQNFGEGPVKRACFASDRTGRAIMDALYDACLIRKIPIYNEVFIHNLLFSGKRCCGVVGYNIADCSPVVFHSKVVIIATGGAGRTFKTTSNGFASTGDGFGLVLNSKLSLKDMEFIQFHPTGIYGLGILVSEAARAEGGILKNSFNEPFMEKYAPTLKDLAPRDIIARAIFTEINEGRGINGKEFVYLDLRDIGKEKLLKKIPEVISFIKTYLGFSVNEKAIPVAPTCHYFMGGIPTDVYGHVLNNENRSVIDGLYAVGECACVSVHGANRLGCNSLIDLVVFGLRTGKNAAIYSNDNERVNLPPNSENLLVNKIELMLEKKGANTVYEILDSLQKLMTEKCSVFRDKLNLSSALSEIRKLNKKYSNLIINDKSERFNYELQTTFELGNMLKTAEVIVFSALNREESRGAHYRTDFSKRIDEKWLKHTLTSNYNNFLRIDYTPVEISQFKPVKREY